MAGADGEPTSPGGNSAGAASLFGFGAMILDASNRGGSATIATGASPEAKVTSDSGTTDGSPAQEGIAEGG